MSFLNTNLLAENAYLREQIKAKDEAILAKDEAILAKDEQIALLAEALKIAQSAQYGRSTEKVKAEFENTLGLDFKDDIEEIKDAIQEVNAIEVPAHTRKKKSNPNLNGRVDITVDLPREEIYLDIPETEKNDPKTGMPLVKIGEDITEQLAIKPAKIYVKRFIRPKYASKQNAISGIKTAELPPHHLNRCKADISFISYLIEQKFLNYLPLYRQCQIFKRLGINIAESTMNDWVNNTALTLEELWKVLGKEIKKTNFINTDDTPLDVLFPDAKSDASVRKTQIAEGRLWCYRSKESGLVYFDFSQNWKSSNPLEFLKGFKGYVQSDGYAGYKKVAKLQDDITAVGCWVHARRKFLQANTVPNQRAEKFITYINLLYRIEHKIKEFREKKLYSEEELFVLRKKRATRVMNIFFKKAKTMTKLPASALGKALGYAINQEKVLRNYILDMKITPDNNAAENAIRPITLARKNFLFAGSPRGGKNVAIFMSLAESCKANGIDFSKYLSGILPTLSKHRTEQELIAMLPHNVKK